MSKRFLYIIIVVLFITNIAALDFWKKGDVVDDAVLGDGDQERIVEKADDQVAKIAGQEITYRDWMRSLRDTHGKSHLEDMINQAAVKEYAEQKDFLISDKVINREISFLTTMSGIMNQDEIAEQEKQWENELRYRYQLEALLTEDIHVSEQEVHSHYGKYRNQYDFTTSFQISHMILSDIETAEKVIGELEQGASFGFLAKEYSLDDDSKDNGGYLGYFTKGSQFVPYGYTEKIENMEEHTYSQPFSLGKEVAIIYLHRYLPEITFEFDELKEHIARELAYEQIDHYEATKVLWDKLDIEWIYD